MNVNKQFYQPLKRHSGRIIVDQYQQRKKQRQQQGICKFCRNQIPIRLMNSHRNVCAFGLSLHSIQFPDKQCINTQGKLGCSTYTQKNNMRDYQDQMVPERIASHRNVVRQNSSIVSRKKNSNNRRANFESASMRNFSQNKNQKESNRKTQGSKKKPQSKTKNSKIFDSKKLFNLDKFQKKDKVNKSMVSQQYKQYFGQNLANHKKGLSKIKKDIKNVWLQQSNNRNIKINQINNANKRKIQKQKRQEKLKRLQNETQKLKRQQAQLINELQRQRKMQRNQNKRNSQIKRQRGRSNSRPKQQNHRRLNSRQVRNNANTNKNVRNANRRNNNSQNRQHNRDRNPTEQSCYQQIPYTHPHQTLNFISQTINQQFQMMKQQFQHMNQFFSNFVPFSNNGFIYFQRNEESDYSLDSSGSSDYEQQSAEKGLQDEQIELLPKYTYQKKIKIDDQCSICISSISHQQIVRRMPCNHLFHCQCINQWLKRKAICPVCRDSVKDLGL